MQEAPQKVSNNDLDILVLVWNFLVKNILGILSVLFGVTMKVHMLRGKFKRITPFQCKLSILISGIAGITAWYVVSQLNIKDFYKAIICAYTPILIEPITLRVIVWVDPIVDACGKALKKLITKKNE